MKKNPLEVQHLSAADWKRSPFEKVILPLGSLESHGGHLPFGTDALTAYLVALDIAARVPKTVVLPPLNYGVSEHYRDFPFTISVRLRDGDGVPEGHLRVHPPRRGEQDLHHERP